MPKKPGAGKKTDARINPPAGARRPRATAASRTAAPGRVGRHAPRSIGELLDRAQKLRQIVNKLPEQQSWSDWLRKQLPEELAAHLVSAIPKGSVGVAGELVVLADSAVWCARLRYALAPLGEAIRGRDAAIGRIRVRVGRPR